MEKLLVLKKMLTDMKIQLETVNKELRTLPQGAMSIENRRGTAVKIHTRYEDGKRIRTSIADDMGMQSKLFRAAILRNKAQCLEQNIKTLERLIMQYKPFSYGNVLHEIEKKSSCDGEELLRYYSRYYDSKLVWAEEYTPTNYRAAERRQVTSRGLYVRSKSEVLIAEKLYEYNLPFRYEQPIEIAGVRLYPDFTIKRADGKIFYWEHEGLTNSEDYLRWQLRKMQLYASSDIVPWDNLIVTYDNSDGIIDLRIVKAEIENKLVL